MKTGDKAQGLGLYLSGCCESDAIFEIDDSFVRCPKCSALCTWELEEKLVSWKYLQGEELIAAS